MGTMYGSAYRPLIWRTEPNKKKNNKAIVDYTLHALCTPFTPFPPIGDAACRQLVNAPELDRAAAVGKCTKNW